MCGLAGYISLGKNNPFIENSQIIQKHRGPDDNFSSHSLIGKYHIGLSHQRLSILDLSSNGRQPMYSKSGNIQIIFNGEIYNHKELRKEFEITTPQSTSDTSLAVELIEKIGIENASRKFRGMWSIVIIDYINKKLFFSRDRIGKKPLYFIEQENSIFFASEIKTLLNIKNLRKDLDTNVISDFITNSSLSRNENTFFRYIKSFPKSNVGEINLDNEKIELKFKKYWDIFSENSFNQRELNSELLKNEISKSIKLRLEADVPVGIALSGGIDSSIIAHCVKSFVGNDSERLNFFSYVNPGHASDESHFIDEVSNALNIPVIKLYDEDITADTMISDISSCNYFNDAPIMSLSSVFFRKLMRTANNHGIKVVLTGQGADEAFCGYRKYPFKYGIEQIRNFNLIRGLSFITPFLINGSIMKNFKFAEAKKYLGFDNSDILSRRLINNKIQFSDKIYRKAIREQQIKDILETSVPALCHYEDRMGMAESIEVRSPFLDHKIIEMGINMKTNSKMFNGWTKYLLRKSFNNTLPQSIIWRKDKKGFSNPEDLWMKEKLINFTKEIANSNNSMIYKYDLIDKKTYLKKLDAYYNGSSKIWFRDIFAPLSLELWLKQIF